jgi:hypothetical protein
MRIATDAGSGHGALRSVRDGVFVVSFADANDLSVPSQDDYG